MGIIAHELMDIDPQAASIFLGNKYDHQRAYRNRFSQQYAKDMRSGNWSTNNPSPIVVAPVCKGAEETKAVIKKLCSAGPNTLDVMRELIEVGSLKTIDGQHRLNAVKMSGQTIQFLVVAVEDAIGFKFMDIGHVRNARDLVDIPNATNACATAKRIVGMEQGFSFRRSIAGTAGVTTVETVQYVDENTAYLNCIVRSASRIRTYVGCGSVSSFASIIHICENVYGEGTYERIEEALRSHDERTVAFVTHLNMLYGGRSSPRAEVTAHKFAEYCKAVLTDGKPTARFGKGLSVLKGWESEYEPEKERSDFYDAKASEDKRKK